MRFRELARDPSPTVTLQSIAFAPDGKRVAACFSYGRLACWDVETGAEVWSRPIDTQYDPMTWLADGSLLAGGPGNVTQINGATGADDWTVEPGFFNNVTPSPDGARAVCASEEGHVCWIPLDDGEMRIVESVLPGSTSAPSWHPSGSKVAFPLELEPGGLRVVDAATDQIVGSLDEKRTYGWLCGWLADGRLLTKVGGLGENHQLRIWDADLKTHRMIFKSASTIGRLVVLADGKRFVTAGDEKLVRLWHADGAEAGKIELDNDSPVQALAVDPSGRWLATGQYNQSLKLWDLGDW